MQTLFLLIGLTTFTLVNSQNRPSDKFFNSLRERDDVSTFGFSKSMIDMIDMNISADTDADGDKKIMGDLNEIKVSIFDKTKNPQSENEAIAFFKKTPFAEVDMNDKDNEARVFVNRKGKTIHECHIGIGGEKKFVLISFFGEFRVEDVKALKKSAKGLADENR